MSTVITEFPIKQNSQPADGLIRAILILIMINLVLTIRGVNVGKLSLYSVCNVRKHYTFFK